MVRSTSSGSLAVSAGAPITSRPCCLTSVQLNPSSAACTMAVYDGSASGTLLGICTSPANGASVINDFSHPVECLTGLYYVLTGTGATAIVTYSLE